MTTETQARRRRRPKLVDAVIVFLLLMVGLNGTGPSAHNQPLATDPDAWALTLVVVAALPVLFWRALPIAMLAVTGAAISVYLGLGYPFGPIMFSGVLAVGLFASTRPVRETLIGGCALLVVSVAAVSAASWGLELSLFERVALGAWTSVWVLVPAAIGVAVGARLEARTRVRAEQARRAVSEEQLRMARELHDVVGHGLAVIAMQAGVGLHVLERNPAKARESLEAIRDTSREALEGLRAELAALRAPAEDELSRRPALGLADLETLVQRVRSGGLDVTLRVDVDPEDIPANVDESSYRIVQEALTNVLRHAGSEATARVRVRRRESWLLVDVEDTGVGARPGEMGTEGSGIRGMRARAEELGGTLEATARDGHGFAVHARLPLHKGKE